MNTTNVTNLEAFGRTILMVVIGAIVAWASNSANLSPYVSVGFAALISGVAGVLESQIKQSGGGGMFGMVR